MKYLKILILALWVSLRLNAQNQHEPQNWQIIKTPFANVIFNDGQKKDAEKIINTIDYIQKNNHTSIGHHFHTIDIVLRSNTATSNGFVTVSPFRSEFFNTSPQTFNNLGTTDWLSTLAIHEYRHVQQFLNHKKGITNYLYYLFGESGWGLGNVLAIPDWYFEGDAVTMETSLTNSGRGRLPKFSALQRAILLENKIYSYQKIRNQSYKDLLPNHYSTGYQMLNFYRNHYKGEKLKEIASKAAAFKFPFYSFSHQLKKQSGLKSKELYQKTITENKRRWQSLRKNLKTTHYTALTKNNNKVKTYAYPQIDETGNVIALKNTFDEIPTFYKIDDKGQETKIIPALIQIDNYFEYQNQQILSTGISYHPRYNNTDYNSIFIYDLKTKINKQITYKKRYFSPSFNTDNTKIITVEKNKNKSYIVILNASNGTPIQTLMFEGHIARPKFIDDTHFVFIQQKNHELAIFKSDLQKNIIQLTPYTHHSIDNIQIANQQVIYSASFNGIDNIYQSPLKGTKIIKQLTNTHIGAYQPCTKNNKIYFTEITKNGNQILYTDIKPTDFKLTDNVDIDWNNKQTIALEGGVILNKIPEKTYKSTPYSSSIFNDLKFHDWSYGFTNSIVFGNITATNLLNDFSLFGKTTYYLNENNSFSLSTVASYKKWFPVLNLGVNYTQRSFNTSFINTNGNILQGEVSYYQAIISPSISIPLAQVKGNYNYKLNANLGYNIYHNSQPQFVEKNSGEKYEVETLEPFYQALSSNFSYSSLRRMATQHIHPQGGFISNFNFLKIMNGSIDGHTFSTNHTLFLPGFFKSHNSFIELAYRSNNTINNNNYFNLTPDSFVYARGYLVQATQSATRVSLNYQLPLLYPDFGIYGITYFKRIRAHLFADLSYVKHLKNNLNTLAKKQNSVGFEIIFDNTFLNIRQTEVGLGYRGSFILNADGTTPKNSYVHGLFLNTTLF